MPSSSFRPPPSCSAASTVEPSPFGSGGSGRSRPVDHGPAALRGAAAADADSTAADGARESVDPAGSAPFAVAELDAWQPLDPAQRAVRDDFRDFAATAPDAAYKSAPGEHLTASGMVFSPDLERVLLCHHGKGGFWVQLGGHIERGDATLLDAARREVAEESGLAAFEALVTHPVELDRHALSSSFGACRFHRDVAFAFVADPDAEAVVVSAESRDVAWWPLDALPENRPDGLGERLARALAEVRRAWDRPRARPARSGPAR